MQYWKVKQILLLEYIINPPHRDLGELESKLMSQWYLYGTYHRQLQARHADEP